MELRCILFLDTSESDIFAESRCIWNVWFLEHTSEMPDLGPSRCTETLVSVGDTSGLRLLFPSRCTEVQILIHYTSGWANIGHFRCIANFHHIEIHRNSPIHTNPDVFQLISREYTLIPSKVIPAQAGKTKQNTSEFDNSYQSRCIQLISREYTCSLSQPTPAQAGKTKQNTSEFSNS